MNDSKTSALVPASLPDTEEQELPEFLKRVKEGEEQEAPKAD